MGQRAAFGWGRYGLHTAQGGFTVRRPLPAASLLMRAAEEDNLAAAWRHVEGNSDLTPLLSADPEEDAPWGADDDPDADDDQAAIPLAALRADMDRLRAGQYQAPELRGYLLPKPDGGVRPLAAPPLRDRVLQRALAQVLTPALYRLMYERSHAYRPGHSRITASYDIQAAWRAGYRWV